MRIPLPACYFAENEKGNHEVIDGVQRITAIKRFFNNEYKLEGLDEEWQVLSSGQNEASFSDLPAGKYVFMVRTEGNQSSVASIEIKINSFFSYKFWIIFIVIVGVLYLFTNKLLHVYRKLKDKITLLVNLYIFKKEYLIKLVIRLCIK
jgi:uncharacterized protein with ParB-like and HNH nuclease domain